MLAARVVSLEPSATRRKLAAIAFGCALLAACVEEPLPRTYTEFMEDTLAREGVLARCNVDREATANDLECINARRAAAAIAAQAEEGLRERREVQSEARRLAARQRADAQAQAQQVAARTAALEEQKAYESQWDENTANVTGVDTIAAETSPLPTLAPSNEPAPSLAPALEPVALPDSAKPPLTTIRLPRGIKPLEYEPPQPQLEEIELPERYKSQ